MKNDDLEKDELLQPYIDAARADEPREQEWQAARSGLHEAIRCEAEKGREASEQPSWLNSVFGPVLNLLQRRPRLRFATISFSAAVLICAVALPIILSTTSPSSVHAQPANTNGQLTIKGPNGEELGVCPLKHTSVEANVTGFISRTIVRQEFENPISEKIEAVYTFPLPSDSAVDSMVMIIGDRRIVGKVREKREARQIYDQARAAGKVASLLDQERPNIFTQSVANIDPGAKIQIEISYVETLKYEDGEFEFHFPMVVAPRYIPSETTSPIVTGRSHIPNDTAPDLVFHPPSVVTDGSRISVPVVNPGVRAGHDISVEVFLNAGMDIYDITSPLHEISVDNYERGKAIVSLKQRKEIPNRDFVLRYRTATDQIGDAFLTSKGDNGRFFMLILQPPRRVTPAAAVPKEMFFVIDRSGSMSGPPIEKAKQTMKLCIEKLNPNDTFNLFSFSGGTGWCFNEPKPNTQQNRDSALKYLNDLYGSGGTEMMPAILEALGHPADPDRLRVVCFMTDGEIGNDFDIIDAVKKNAGTTRVFAFGIGNSVNHFLLDAMAHEGRGEVQYVNLNTTATVAAEKFCERIHAPVLTDISIDWKGLPVTEIMPAHFPDLFSVKPLVICGRLNGVAEGSITLKGRTADGEFTRDIAIHEGAASDHPDAIDALWARSKVDDLMNQDMHALQMNQFPQQLRDEITTVGVKYGIMTQFTSFVAVDESSVTTNTQARQVSVPAENPDGQTWGKESSDYFFDYARTKLARSEVRVKLAQSQGRARSDMRAYVTGIESYYIDNKSLAGNTPTGAVHSPGTSSNGTISAGDVWRVKCGEDRAYGLQAGSSEGRVQDELLVYKPQSQPQQLIEQQQQATATPRSQLPDVYVGDQENNIDANKNLFVFPNAFKFDDYVADGNATGSRLQWSFDEGSATTGPNSILGVRQLKVNGDHSIRTGDKQVALIVTPDTAKKVSATKLASATAALHKLPSSLRGLRALLDADGNFTSGTLKVRGYEVKLKVWVSTDRNMRLELGSYSYSVQETSEPDVLICGVDVRRLIDLALLPEVLQIELAP